MERVLVLGARRYDFTAKDGGHVEGVQVSYITDDVVEEPNQRGCSTFQVSAPLGIWPDLARVPAVYDVDFRQRPGLKGKPTLHLVSANFVSSFRLEPSQYPAGNEVG